jgi:hypothetical protein
VLKFHEKFFGIGNIFKKIIVNFYDWCKDFLRRKPHRLGKTCEVGGRRKMGEYWVPSAERGINTRRSGNGIYKPPEERDIAY